MATSNSTPTPANTVPVFFPNFVAYVHPKDVCELQAFGRQLLDVAETAIAAAGDVETDPDALWASVAAARAAIDVEHRARQFVEQQARQDAEERAGERWDSDVRAALEEARENATRLLDADASRGTSGGEA